MDQSQYLTLEHIKKGANGYADFALSHSFKEKLACVDYARQKVKYKNKDNQVISDPELTALAPKFFNSIYQKNRELIIKRGIELYSEDTKEAEEEHTILLDMLTDVSKISQGLQTELRDDWAKTMCSKTIVKE